MILAAELAKIKFLKSRKKPTLSDVLNFASLLVLLKQLDFSKTTYVLGALIYAEKDHTSVYGTVRTPCLSPFQHTCIKKTKQKKSNLKKKCLKLELLINTSGLVHILNLETICCDGEVKEAVLLLFEILELLV